MNNEKKKDWTQFSTTVPHKFLKTIKLHAFKDDTSMSDILVRYQNAYLEKLEREKSKRKQKENKKE